MMWVFPGLISVYVNQLTRADYSAFLIQAGKGEQLLRWSREVVGRLEELERLQSDENAEHERRTVEAWPPLLSDAIDSLQANAVEEALAWGDDVNKQDERGWPPLLRAAARGAVEVAVLLKGRGADPRAVRGGWTALMWATAAGSRELVALFLAEGASDWEAKHKRDHRAVRSAAIATLIFAAVASAFGVSMRIWPKEPAPPFFGGCFLLAFLVSLSVFVWALFRCRKTARMKAAFAEMVPADGGIQRERGASSFVTRAGKQPDSLPHETPPATVEQSPQPFWVVVRRGPLHSNESWYVEQLRSHFARTLPSPQKVAVFADPEADIGNPYFRAAILARKAGDWGVDVSNGESMGNDYTDGDGYQGVVISWKPGARAVGSKGGS
jgi:hypothetical protein